MSWKRYFGFFGFLIFTASCQQKATPASPSFEPVQNILFLIGDDHSASVLGGYGNTLAQTPNLDRLAQQGIRFTNAFANAPMCSASRQSFLTGRYPHAAGVTLLRTSFPEEQVTLAEHLAERGFSTGAIGKMHFNNSGKHGFDFLVTRRDYFDHLESNPPREPASGTRVRPTWKPFRDPARIWLNAETLPGSYYDEDDVGTFYSMRALDFIRENQDERFCLFVGFHEPHSPFNFPIEFQGSFDPAEMPLPEGSPEDDRWIPAVFRDLTQEEKRGIVAAYHTSVQYLDKNVGLILDGLEELGLSEKTMVVYIGDHGYLLNDHKRFEKHTMWEAAVRAPLIVRARGLEPGVRDALVEFVDLAPTFMESAGVEPMTTGQGRSLMHVLLDPDALHKGYVFSEFLADNKAMVRSSEWKYVFTSGKRDLGQGYATGFPPPGITHRLYDLESDPDETTDVSEDPRNSEVLANLKRELLDWFRRTDPRSSQVPDDMTIEEQLVAFCEPPDVGGDVSAK